jgi:predicted Zn-dependent peptidase
MRCCFPVLAALLAAFLVPAPGTAQSSFRSLDEEVREYRLDNGLTLLVVENHDSPTIGVITAFSVGAAEERPGLHGVTHILEHMLFKGTTEIGTSDWEAEKVHLDRIEDITWAIKAERRRGREADFARIEELLAAREREIESAKAFAKDNDLSGLYEEAGGVNLNAFTSYDWTAYVQSIPANRLELWMYLESERLRRPVLRQFYTEVQNILEERRMGVESTPAGKLTETLLSVAFDAHGYGFSIIGFPADIASITRTETEEWFRVYYAPNRMALSIVGDVEPDRVRRMAEEYFGDIPRQEPPEPLETFDLPISGMRRVEVEFDAEPRIMMAWHKKTRPHPDDAALHVISEILTGGRSSRLQKDLVEGRQIAASVSIDHEFPGRRWDNLILLEALPRAPHTAAELEEAIREHLDRLGSEPPGERELSKAKNRIRAARIRALESNFGLALELAAHQASFGDWRVLLEVESALAQVTAEDVQRVARATFPRNRMIVATLVPKETASTATEAAETAVVAPERLEAGRAVVARMVEALGGEERLASVRSVRSAANVQITTPHGPMQAVATSVYALPDRMRAVFSLMGQTQVQVLTAEDAWLAAGGSVMDLPAEEARASRSDLERELFLLAYPALADGYVVGGGEGEEGSEVIKVRGPSGSAFTVRLDAETSRPAGVRYRRGHPRTGVPAEFVETYSDYREISGVFRPHRIVTTVDGEAFAESAVTEVVIDGEIAADDFQRPAG